MRGVVVTDSGITRWVRPAVILVATDLTDLDRLMPFALQQALETSARLVMLHVIHDRAGMAANPIGTPGHEPATVRESATKILETSCSFLRQYSVECDAVVREGDASQKIADSAREFQADRILMGTRNRSKGSKLLLGSVVKQVLRSVNPPVMTVGPEAYLRVNYKGDEKVVLYATTLGETSRPGAVLACRIAAAGKARLVLLHVLPQIQDIQSSGQPALLHSSARRKLRQLVEESGALEICGSRLVETRIEHGIPSDEILAAASELKASLIVLGTTQRSTLLRLTRDRTIYHVLAHARCPVLTLIEPLPADQPRTFQHIAVPA